MNTSLLKRVQACNRKTYIVFAHTTQQFVSLHDGFQLFLFSAFKLDHVYFGFQPFSDHTFFPVLASSDHFLITNLRLLRFNLLTSVSDKFQKKYFNFIIITIYFIIFLWISQRYMHSSQATTTSL